jgi:hypothetical protein
MNIKSLLHRLGQTLKFGVTVHSSFRESVETIKENEVESNNGRFAKQASRATVVRIITMTDSGEL